MSAIDFLIAIHNHQPVGNFGSVFEDCFDNCYDPQLNILESHPDVRISLHYSGPLLEWIEDNRPRHLDKIGKLVDRGQVEILSGGFYEPILPSIPQRDAVGQIEMMNEYIKNRFGYNPTGLWTAERIWDPGLPMVISAAGLKYTLLDDTHFYYAGLTAEDMFGYYTTEKNGECVAVFPIDKALRYSIPFKLPSETIDYIKQCGNKPGVKGITYGDDGEKFGVWPGTYKWVYEEKWLDNFYGALEENSDDIRLVTFSEFMERNQPSGRIYLPASSYEEMMEWTLSLDAGARFKKALDEISAMDKRDEWKPFIRGGLWDNFLAKYEESNRMHKKMLYVSGKVEKAGKNKNNKAMSTARRELYRGQCNCAYWHGLFGGLYLNFLRHAVYEHLIEAEKQVDLAVRKNKTWVEVTRFDFDADGNEEIIFENRELFACFAPARGGCLTLFDYRPANFSLTNTLTRRKEAYHLKLTENPGAGIPENSQPASIHDISQSKEANLSDFLKYDSHDRHCFQDHFLNADVSIDDFMDGNFQRLGDFIDGDYKTDICKSTAKSAKLKLSREGNVYVNGEQQAVTVIKSFSADNKTSAIAARYEVVNHGNVNIECRLGIEFNLTLLAVDAEDRYWVVPGSAGRQRLKEKGDETNISNIGMRDDWFGFEVAISSDQKFDSWRFPVETVSQSESGFERTYQGSCVVLLYQLRLSPGESETFNITLSAEKTK